MNRQTFLVALAAGGRTALACSILGFVLLVVYSQMVAENVLYLPRAVSVIGLASVLLGGVQGGKAARMAGWLHGGAVAALYLAGLQVLRMAAFPASGLNTGSMVFAAGALAAGCIGGIAGINIRFARVRSMRRRYMG